MPNNFCVYQLTCVVSGKHYVGQTNNITKRMRLHRTSSFCRALHNAIKAHGWDAFQLSLLHENLSVEEANRLEVAAIERLNTLAPNGYNLRVGGDNRRLSEETKQRIREARIGRGRTHSEETKQRMRLAAKARGPMSEETKQKIRESKQGKPSPTKGKQLRERTPEHLQRLSEAKTGKNNPNFGKPGTMLGRKQTPESVEARVLSRKAKKDQLTR